MFIRMSVLKHKSVRLLLPLLSIFFASPSFAGIIDVATVVAAAFDTRNILLLGGGGYILVSCSWCIYQWIFQHVIY